MLQILYEIHLSVERVGVSINITPNLIFFIIVSHTWMESLWDRECSVASIKELDHMF